MNPEFKDKLPPHDERAERQVLGGILRDPEVFPDVRALVGAADFYFDPHQRVFAAVETLIGDRKPVDLSSVHHWLSTSGQLEDVGGATFLADLWSEVPIGATAAYYARFVRDAALLRGLIHACVEILRDAHNPAEPAEDLIGRAERMVMGVADSIGETRIDLRKAPDILRDALARIDERIASGVRLAGLATGYDDLDDLLGGLRPGQMVVVGARPSAGKTAFGLNVCVNVMTRGEPVAFLSLEMPESEISGRLLSMGSGVSMHKLSRSGSLTADEAQQLTRTASTDGFGGCDFYMSDAPDVSASSIASMLRRAVRKYGIQLVVVDYLQLLRPDNPRDNRTQQVGLSARQIKNAARETGVPVILLCQLNREVENRQGGRPRLADLRESGEIEQHADAVILLHPQPNQPADQPMWLTDVIVGKNRNGPIGEVTLAYRRTVMRFENAAVGSL